MKNKQGLTDGIVYIKESLARLENSKYRDADDAGNINDECDRFIEVYQSTKEEGLEPRENRV